MGPRPCSPLRIQVLCLLEAQLQTSLNIFVKRDLALALRQAHLEEQDEIPPGMFPAPALDLLILLKPLCNLRMKFSDARVLGAFLKAASAKPEERSGGPSRAPGEGSWPMPLPYPEVFAAEPKSLAPGELKKLVVNIQICLLNYLDLGRPSRAPPNQRWPSFR